LSQEKRRLIMRAAWMRCSTVIPSSRRNSLKRESVADLLRLAARDVGLGFPVEGILNKHKPTRLISSIRNRSLFRNTRRQVERLFRQSRMLIAEQFIVPSATPTPTPKIAPTYEPLPNSTPDATSKALEAAQKENSDERSSASEATQKALQSAIKESSEERGSAPDATQKALQSAIRDRKEAEEKQAIEKKGTKSPTE